MRPKKYRLDNPYLTEFIYSVLYNATFDEKRILPPRLLKFVRQERVAKKFVKNATLDEAITLLSYLGIGHALILFDTKHGSIKALQGILDKYKDKKPIRSLKDVVDARFFVSTDKEFNTLLGLMAQTIHHRSYQMGLEYTRVGHHIHNWSRRLNPKPDDSQADMTEKSNLLATTLLSSALTLEKAEFLFSLKPLDMQLLWYLYPLKHTYVPITQLYHALVGQVQDRKVLCCIKNLVNTLHIQSSALDRREYTITALGIRVVEQFFEAVSKANHLR